MRRVIRAHLKEKNFFACGEAVDGRNAIEKALELNPALILLDLAMPQLNGLEAACVVRGRLPDVRLVLFTMYNEVLGSRSLTPAMGIDAVVSKMDGMSALAECIQRLLAASPQNS
jgi:DNA-binding NarL/FixJ family response regulator